jgi:glycosyltransferase involved in cell wall biosynthesis
MRILYLSQYFPPEIGATQTRAHEMARGLVRAGHQVTLLTEVPNHPTGIVPPEYRGKLWERSELDGIEVLRLWVKASPVKTFRRRMAFYASYMVMATFAGLFLAKGKYSLIYATSPPLFVGAAALALSLLRRTPLVFEVRDLWPESAVELGELRNKRAQRLATWLEERCYRRAKRIVVVTGGIEARLVERGRSPQKLVLIPNGANTEVFSPRPPDTALRKELGIDADRYIAIYTGLHGLAQGLETVLEAARLLRSDPDIVFLLVGDGPRKPVLVEMAGEMRLENVIFRGAVAERELPRYLSLANVGVHAYRRMAICRGALPVKMFSYMASGLPVVLAAEGEAGRLLREADAGVVVPPENPGAFAQAILELKSASEVGKLYAQAGVAYVRANYSRQELAQRLVSALEEVSSETSGRLQ